MALFHFSDRADIARFVPRPSRLDGARPLVWAIDAAHAPLYLFPRQCPRILLWPQPGTTPVDRVRWFGDTNARMVAYIEDRWREEHASARLYRYLLPGTNFEDLRDAGMHVSPVDVEPLSVELVADLPGALREADVELRVVPSLIPLRGVWSSTLHASGIRLTNAKGWDGAG